MSAPPPVAMPTAVMTTVPVSRLPKFTASSSRLTKPALTPKNSSGHTTANANANTNADMGQATSVNTGKPVSSTASRLSVGFYHHSAINSGVKTSLINVKQNCFIRAPTNFTAKWRKENVEDASADFEYKSGKSANCKKSPKKFTGKTQNAASGPKAIPKAGKVAPKSTLNCLSKKQNESSLPKSRSASPSEVKKAMAARSRSSDGVGSASNDTLTTGDKARSRSLTQVQRRASPTAANPPGKSRAYSTNRAERKTTGAATAASVLPAAMMKKPLAPRLNGGGSFKLKSFKAAAPIRVQSEAKRNQRRNSVETPSDPGSSPEAPECRGPSAAHGSQNEVSMLGETLEDMSLSSTSSLDHEGSLEYMDDFDLGSGGGMLLTSCAQNDDEDSGLDRSRFHDDDEGMVVGVVSAAADLCFLDDGLDWNRLRLAGDRGHALRRLSRGRRCSQPDSHSQCGSSLDLSPSDSCGSGGTFLWDEEVEPLGGGVQMAAAQASACGPLRVRVVPEPDRPGSLRSDVSGVESCDLDEDDLMLDVDFPEDLSLTSGRSPEPRPCPFTCDTEPRPCPFTCDTEPRPCPFTCDTEPADGASYMAEWRRRQLCWGSHSDSEFHSDGVSEEQNQRKDSELSLCLSSLGACPGLAVQELVDDCSALKSQLESLQKILLLQEDDADEDTLTTDTLSPETDSSSDGTETQVEVLLQEVLQLREEVRSRDQTIAQLSQQLSAATTTSSRCRCEDVERSEVQTQTRGAETESRGSQTPWNQSAAPVLFLSPPWQYQRSSPFRARTKPGLSQRGTTKRVETLVHYFTDRACLRYFSPIKASRTH